MKSPLLKRIIIFVSITGCAFSLSLALYFAFLGPINVSFNNVETIGIVVTKLDDKNQFYYEFNEIDNENKNSFIKDAKKVIPHKSSGLFTCKCKDSYMIRINYINGKTTDVGAFNIIYYKDGVITSSVTTRANDKNDIKISNIYAKYFK